MSKNKSKNKYKSSCIKIIDMLFLALFILVNQSFAYAQTASILPPAKTQFLDSNGKPLVSGTVTSYIPGTTTPKTTWQDAAETIPNANPLTLDSAGRALLLGSGSYRQIVKDRFNNIIWDQVTSSTGSGGGGGSTATGDGDLVGTIKPWAGMTAPNQYVFTYGQELSRVTFASLFTAITSTQAAFCTSGSPIVSGIGDTTNFWIGMSVEIPCVGAGFSTIISKTSSSVTLAVNANTNLTTTAIFFPWGRGNGTTTFNLPDFRGLIPAGNNIMGGVASSNMTAAFFGAADPNSSGGQGGGPSTSLGLTNLPTGITSSNPGSIALSVVSNRNVSDPGGSAQGGGTVTGVNTTASPITSTGTLAINAVPVTSNNTGSGGSPVAFSRIPPTKTVNYIIKTTPDLNSATASGVTSLGGMTGDIACGTGLLCTGNTISSTVVVPVSLINGGLGGSQAAATAGQVPVFPGGGGAAVPTTFSAGSGIITNLLPNVQWQLWTTVPFTGGLNGKVTADGKNVQTASTCASFTPTASSTPVFTCANTGAIRVNDFVVNSIVAFWGFAGVGYAGCAQVNCINGFVTAAQVSAVVANTSITVQSPFENPGAGVSPAASSSSTLLAVAPYGFGIYGPDGWNKTTTLLATIDDWGTAATPASTVYPGCERPLLLRKGVTGQETFTYNISPQDIPRWQGQTVTFGAVVYQRVQGGASTWNLHIDDNAGSNASANGTGASLGAYQFLTTTRNISTSATSIAIYINLLGNAGDVFDVCLPTAAFSSSLAQFQLGQRYGEIIRANGHWNPPLMNSWHINMPSTELITGSGLYGYNGINLEAISLGVYHKSVGNIYCMLEIVSSTAPPVILFTGARTSIVPGNNLSFGPRITTSTANIIVAGGLSRWPIYHDGTITIFSNILGLVMSGANAATFDCTDVDTTPASSIN